MWGYNPSTGIYVGGNRAGKSMYIISIRGIWLQIDAESVGTAVKVIVELPDGTLKEAIKEMYPGPVSHYVHPSGIAASETISKVW